MSGIKYNQERADSKIIDQTMTIRGKDTLAQTNNDSLPKQHECKNKATSSNYFSMMVVELERTN